MKTSMDLFFYIQVLLVSVSAGMQRVRWPCGFSEERCTAEEFVRGYFAYPSDCTRYFVCALKRDRRTYAWQAKRCDIVATFFVFPGSTSQNGSCRRSITCRPVTCRPPTPPPTITPPLPTTTSTTSTTKTATTTLLPTSLMTALTGTFTARSTSPQSLTTHPDTSESLPVTSLPPFMPTGAPPGNKTTPAVRSNDVTSSAVIIAVAGGTTLVVVAILLALLWWKKGQQVKIFLRCSTKKNPAVKSTSEQDTYQDPAKVFYSIQKSPTAQFHIPNTGNEREEKRNNDALYYQNIPENEKLSSAAREQPVSDELYFNDNSLYEYGYDGSGGRTLFDYDDRRNSTDSRVILLPNDAEEVKPGLKRLENGRKSEDTDAVQMKENSLYVEGPESPIYNVPVTPSSEGQNSIEYSYAYSHQNSTMGKTLFEDRRNRGGEDRSTAAYADSGHGGSEGEDGTNYYCRVSAGTKYDDIEALSNIAETGATEHAQCEPFYLELIDYSTQPSKRKTTKC